MSFAAVKVPGKICVLYVVFESYALIWKQKTH